MRKRISVLFMLSNFPGVKVMRYWYDDKGDIQYSTAYYKFHAADRIRVLKAAMHMRDTHNVIEEESKQGVYISFIPKKDVIHETVEVQLR